MLQTALEVRCTIRFCYNSTDGPEYTMDVKLNNFNRNKSIRGDIRERNIVLYFG